MRKRLIAIPVAFALGVGVLPSALNSSSIESAVARDTLDPNLDANIPYPKLARLGERPNWSALDKYQRTITKAEFEHLLNHCYARNEADYEGLIEIHPDRARIIKQSNFDKAGFYDLHFLTDRRKTREVPRYWTAPWKMKTLPENDNQPLQGIHIAIDPGHIGGQWAGIEGRSYTIGENTIPVEEGAMTLRVAEILKSDLEKLGATISLTRVENEPVTDQRPADLGKEARIWLLENRGLAPDSLVEATAKRMFYVSSEIRTRAEILNEDIQPDIALCLHFDAAPWKNPYKPSFTKKNHLHLLINGCYSAGEIAEDDTRFEMVERLLQRVYYYELEASKELADAMADETRLPPFKYNGNSGKSVSDNEYVWARNLLANRKFNCPVIFFEPYCMNNQEVHSRVQAGEYNGLKEFNGVYRKNIFQEYADGVTSGLVNYFRKVR